ncbi:MAG: hypothetical protein WD002_00940 [Pseudomonadales bacterium]
MTGSISQMQMLYNPEEDRILFRLNTTSREQFRFWLTRRYTMLLLKVLKEHVEADPDISMQGTAEAKQAVKSFKQEKAIQSANFKEQFVEESNELPLGHEIPLAFRLTYNVKDKVLSIGIQPREGQGINMTITQEINASLAQLLISAAKKGEWALEAVTPVIPDQRQDNIVIN